MGMVTWTRRLSMKIVAKWSGVSTRLFSDHFAVILDWQPHNLIIGKQTFIQRAMRIPYWSRVSHSSDH